LHSARKARIFSINGTQEVELEHFFLLPRTDVLRENILRPGEVVTQILVPAARANTHSIYLEAREQKSFDWPLASVAAAVESERGRVRGTRIVMGGVAPIPWRVPEAEKALAGATLDSTTAARAAELALKDAKPLADNAYKVAIAKTLVRRAILEAGGKYNSQCIAPIEPRAATLVRSCGAAHISEAKPNARGRLRGTCE
jgi:xanthine dehydrogenase YagS FAD-binding subunit